MKTFLLLVDELDSCYSGTVFALIVRATSEEAARETVQLQNADFTIQSCDEYAGEIELRSSGEVIYG